MNSYPVGPAIRQDKTWNTLDLCILSTGQRDECPGLESVIHFYHWPVSSGGRQFGDDLFHARQLVTITQVFPPGKELHFFLDSIHPVSGIRMIRQELLKSRM